MNRDKILEQFQTRKHILMGLLGVTGLAMFGSFARDEATTLCRIDRQEQTNLYSGQTV